MSDKEAKSTSSHALYGNFLPDTWYFLWSTDGSDILITANSGRHSGKYLGALLTDEKGEIKPAYQTMTKGGRATMWGHGGIG